MEQDTINIAIDIETLSTLPTAAIICISAKAFFLECSEPVNKLTIFVDATSCAMHGMHFDMDTVKWWSRQSKNAKDQFLLDNRREPLEIALSRLSDWVQEVRDDNPGSKMQFWSQGSDFDFSILRHAYAKVNLPTPWKYKEVRDARTFIITAASLLRPDVDNPYSIIPDNPNKFIPHNASSDVDQLIWNVTYIHQILQEAIL